MSLNASVSTNLRLQETKFKRLRGVPTIAYIHSHFLGGKSVGRAWQYQGPRPALRSPGFASAGLRSAAGGTSACWSTHVHPQQNKLPQKRRATDVFSPFKVVICCCRPVKVWTYPQSTQAVQASGAFSSIFHFLPFFVAWNRTIREDQRAFGSTIVDGRQIPRCLPPPPPTTVLPASSSGRGGRRRVKNHSH